MKPSRPPPSSKELYCMFTFLNNYLFIAKKKKRKKILDFPGGLVVMNLLANARDTGSIPDLGRFLMLQSN